MVNRVAGGQSEYLCVNADVYNVNWCEKNN
jgi:hypothetical protein